ncbi:PiggyBac transposable element-derived protein 4 [Plakobranchus ocellatus]|uniref:PiggyBac transposable element-derived protein 4 n=1 Tax=Plakobranchus ocellatus TaxID=259542 RepID=A0AAV3YXG0_9GAST|nr:PiggyBac transposable element-derived protein 4 [Plakobranchus ocellatus]
MSFKPSMTMNCQKQESLMMAQIVKGKSSTTLIHLMRISLTTTWTQRGVCSDRNGTCGFQLCEPFFGSGRNLTCDNFFTDMELCKALSTEKLTMVGALRRNKAFIPPEFQDPKQTEKGKPRFVFRKVSMLVSYMSGQKKNVIVLSSMHSDAAIVPEKGEKNSRGGKLLQCHKG